MIYDACIVGGGIGGLTVAALLASRGASVCVLERASNAGGCAGMFEHSGYRFETGAGLYAAWGTGDIHERVFAELKVAPPEVKMLTPSYIVRLPDQTDVRVGADDMEFETELRAAFPECADAALRFYRELAFIAEAIERAARRFPALATISKFQQARRIASEPRHAARVLAGVNQTAAQHLSYCSTRFRRFIDAQLQIFAQRASDECAYLYAAVALMQARRGMYAMRGGAQSLASALVESIVKSGGVVRCDAPVLRLAYDSSGSAIGVTLLSGEIVEARRIVSNLTIWDTYGKLVGLNRTPPEIRARLKNLRGWGAYQLYLGMDEEAARRLPAGQMLTLNCWQTDRAFDAEEALLMFSAAPEWDARAPYGKRAVTVSTFTDAERWFAFHEDESEHEEQDKDALEKCWARLHAAMPELGAGIEVIETATPRTFYERTRRKLGMVGGVGQSLDVFGARSPTHRTALPNLFLVGDTAFPGQGVAAVTYSALIVANEIAPPART